MNSVKHRTVAVKDLCSTEEAAERLDLEPATLSTWKQRYDLSECVAYDHPLLTIWDISKLRPFVKSQKRKRNGQRVILEGVKHGTRSAYNKGCRCDPCTDAAAAYMREKRAK